MLVNEPVNTKTVPTINPGKSKRNITLKNNTKKYFFNILTDNKKQSKIKQIKT